MITTVKLPPVIHTWRDGTYHFQGKWGENDKEHQAKRIADEIGVHWIIELRHIKGTTRDDMGHILSWKNSKENGWRYSLLGECREQDLTEYLKDDYQK
jgi:hypothetical protein